MVKNCRMQPRETLLEEMVEIFLCFSDNYASCSIGPVAHINYDLSLFFFVKMRRPKKNGKFKRPFVCSKLLQQRNVKAKYTRPEVKKQKKGFVIQ